MTQAQSKSYGGVKKKLMGAICMLLVASIMVVSSTYAWFTLSTAPEITGISTSVGANGNLEMALLNSETFADLNKITSAVGDSSAAAGKKVTESNITWGNLVDLSDASYGLDKINLMPAALTIDKDGTNGYKTTITRLLATPTYGADGRVVDLSGTTVSTVRNAENTAWAFDAAKQTYGVRAIGIDATMSAQQSGLMSAKTEYSSALSEAKTIIQAALSTNGQGLASAVTQIAMNSADADLKTEHTTAISNMVTAAEQALEKIDAAYIAVLKAAVASSVSDENAYKTAIAAINGTEDAPITTYAAAKTALEAVSGVTVTEPDGLSDAANALATQKQAVADAKTEIGNDAPDYKTALTKLVDTSKVTINGYKTTRSTGDNADTSKDLMGADGNINSTFMNAVLKDGGAVVEMPDGSGVFAYIGSVAGNYAAATKVNVNFKGLVLEGMNATMKTKATENTEIKTALAALTAATTTSTTQSLSDTYGYALDLAFRTNAAGSYLKLQTEAANRVYSDGTGTATQGSGSTMTFKSTMNDKGTANLTDDQVKGLMQAINVAFINPETGAIYGIAGLDNIQNTGDGMKGDLVLFDIGDEKGTGTPDPYYDMAKRTATDGTEAKLMDLNQNEAAKMTVVVYLNGRMVDNSDVANATQSVTGTMNLQFSSSATLTPMENTALRNMEAKTTTGGGAANP